MRLHFLFFPSALAAALISCTPVLDPSVTPIAPPDPITSSEKLPSPDPAAGTVVAPQAPSYSASAPQVSQKNLNGIQFEGVSFDSRSHRLAVVDQAGGPGSAYQSSAAVAKSKNALLAINAGFFTPEGAPLGLVVSGGETSGGWNSASSLGNGIFRESPAGTLSITRRSSKSSVSASRELIQAGPLLLENGMPISGLDNGKSALRSIILTDGKTRWWIGKTSSCTLASLGKALQSGSPAPWRIVDALNLDGGRSTDLYISSRIQGGPINSRGFLNRPVRNFLILIPR